VAVAGGSPTADRRQRQLLCPLPVQAAGAGRAPFFAKKIEDIFFSLSFSLSLFLFDFYRVFGRFSA
jgi:hypothetical protein